MVDRAFTTLVAEVAPSVPGCPQSLILQHIRKAAIRVCERTLLWRWAEPPYALTPGVTEYAYNKPINADVHVVFSAVLNDYPMERLTLEQAIANYPQWADFLSGESAATLWSLTPSTAFNTQPYNEGTFNDQPEFHYPESVLTDASEPRSICQISPDKYIVLPLPDNTKTYSLRMFYALKPKRNADSMDSNALDELEDTIVHSALQELLVLPNVAWADRELATYHARQFLAKAAERRARANLSNFRGHVAVQFPTFA